jgi:hypothetical protein
MLRYADITQNTYVQSRTVTEIIAREKCGFWRVHALYLSPDKSYQSLSSSVVSIDGSQ